MGGLELMHCCVSQKVTAMILSSCMDMHITYMEYCTIFY